MLLRHLPLIAIAAAAMGAPAFASICERTTVTYQECQPETRTWISGHYEWQCDDYIYVPGHWVIEPATCRTTRVVESEACHEPVVYAQTRCDEPRVVYTQPRYEREACHESVVYAQPRCDEPRVVYTQPRCERETVVYTRPAPYREEPRHRTTVVISAPPLPIPRPSSVVTGVRIVPLPVPVPFPFPGLFRHHR